MKFKLKTITFGLLSALLISGSMSAGDKLGSLIVQTFTFNDISDRRKVFNFPDDERKWSKILMCYTLKCDEVTTGDTYPCGEWDVSTFTCVYKHTGLTDRKKSTHSEFVVNGSSPQEFSYSDTPVYYYYTDWSGDSLGTESDRYLKFEGTDFIEVPAEAGNRLKNAFTIAMWVRGDDSQPLNGSILEASDRGGRVLNIHLPWGTGEVYFDAGGRLMGNNNRIQKYAEPGNYKGRWNHWAFTKDTAKGEQRIYLNGELWHSAPGMTKTIDNIDKFIIGAGGSGDSGHYAGCIDDVQIWDAALDGEAVEELMSALPDESFPDYSSLVLYYTFDELADGNIRDSSPNSYHGKASGQPQSMKYGIAGRNDRKPQKDDILVTEKIEAPKCTVRFYRDTENPEKITDTLEVWEAVEKYFDGSGRLLEEKPLEEFKTLYNSVHEYYGEPFEVMERYEIGRFITPYGKGLDLGGDGFTWIYDVTDYAPLLKGEVDLEAHNEYELLDLKFVFFEGIPSRDVLSVKNIWTENASTYQDIADDRTFKTKVMTADENGRNFIIRSRISGHGHFGPRNCCEWDAKDHYLSVNGIRRFEWNVWRDCGMNPVHPQGGTWQFDRAGWCPGTWVDTYDHEITPYVVPGQEFAVDYCMQPYDPESGEQGGSYITEHQFFTFGAPNFKRDAEILEILAPNDHDEFRRLNPVSVNPVVKIRNSGAEPLKSLTIEYGLSGNERSVFEWHGELGFMETETVVLPGPGWKGMKKSSEFTADVLNPNGMPDENGANNRLTVTTEAPIKLPGTFVFFFKAQGFGRAAQNTLLVTDAEGQTVFRKSDFEDNREYSEKISLKPGAYQLEFRDSEEDGLIRHWWLRGHDPDSIGDDGRIQVRSTKGKVLLDLGYDFAEKRTLRFFVGEPR